MLMNTKPNITTDREASAKPRFQRAERRQIEWRPLSLDQMLPDDHPSRLVWAYVESLDLSELYQAIRAIEGQSFSVRIFLDNGNQPAVSPLATFDLTASVAGTGSALTGFGCPTAGCPWFSYSANLPNFLLGAAGTYWISVLALF